jgi:hypothetical protein
VTGSDGALPICFVDLVHLVDLVCFVYLVDLVHLVSPISLIQPNKQDKPNNGLLTPADFPRILLQPKAHGC